MTVQTEAKINEMLSNTQTLVERTNDALSVIDKANAKAVNGLNALAKTKSDEFIALSDSKADKSTTPILANTRIIKTVGVGGDFTNLNDAFNYAGKVITTCRGDYYDHLLELKLISDITINKQTTFQNPACKLYINGAKSDGKYTINYDFNAFGEGGGEINPLLFVTSNVIINNVIFRANTQTTKSANLIHQTINSYLECNGCEFYGENIAIRGIRNEHNSKLRLLSTKFDNFKNEGVVLNERSSAFILSCSSSNCKNNFLCLTEGASAEIWNLTLSGTNPTYAIGLYRGSYVSLGGTLNLNNCSVSNIAKNTLTANGILLN